MKKLVSFIQKNKALSITFGVFMLVTVLLGAASLTPSSSSSVEKKTEKKATPTPKKAVVAKLEIFTAPVEVKLPGAKSFTAGKKGMEIKEGTEIKTGASGRGQILYPSGSVTRLDFNSHIKVKDYEPDPQNVIIQIIKGRIWSRIHKLLGNESYQTETGTLVATVRGTSYGHGLLPDSSNRGTVLKGEVDMECIKEEEELTLVENEKATVNCAKGTGLAVLDVLKTDLEDEWIAFNIKEDERLDERFGEETYDDAVETPTPTPSKKVTPTKAAATNTPTPNATNTTAPTNSPTSAPTAIPNTPVPVVTPPVMSSVSESGGDNETTTVINISGSTLLGATVTLNNVAATSATITTDGTRIVAVFPIVECGTYEVKVSVAGVTLTNSSVAVSNSCFPPPIR